MNESQPLMTILRTEAEDSPPRYTPTDAEREVILDTMRGWLAGEPVWTYNDVLERWGPQFEMYRRRWDRAITAGLPGQREREREMRLMLLRDPWIKEFGFAIPCRELLDALKSVSPLVEIGAGSGWLTALARRYGVDVVGTDPGIQRYGFETGRHDPQQLCLQGKTAVRRFRDRTVVCSWPTLDATWFRQALKAMRIGQRIVVIREDACAEDSAWAYLEACFIEEKEIEIPAWPFINDYAAVWRKRHQRA